MPKFKRKAPKRRREDLGKVVSFVVQELLDPLKTGNADDVETEVDGIAEIGAATDAEGGAITKNGDGNETAGKGIEQIESLEGTGLSSE